MSPVLVLVVIAVLLAVAVLALALVAGSKREGVTLREGLRSARASRREGRRVGVIAGTRRDLTAAADADATQFEDLLRAATTPGPAYVSAEDLAAPLRAAARR